MMKFVLAILLTLSALPALAGGPFPAIADEAVARECGECHMLYYPQMLPQKSWKIIMDGLADHFGENAALEQDVLKKVTDYHVANAADVDDNRLAKKFMEGVDLSNPPLKVTTTPRFIKKHSGIPDQVFTQKEVGSKARCGACHLNAKDGRIDDDDAVIPGYINLFGVTSIKKFW
ncbi:MAG: hypothetical protein A3G18_09985 [Rhodospirillales bacterium RIFCSPLOWO2_12_FULL_58_28]|nr:MAG: hypothetical protein A3H92_08160 [Rhodospirillales bacterium RIFCSPLOWO2_02_FULL_58_16]OHC77612.1 MAG: hypothetical protein A3G18_09985 [Rhodospirillales bacterium RIFCSPLOWO2_12_FULL_58_28]